MKTVVMPKMGDTMESGKILSWLKAEGDHVDKGEAIAEIETDKVNIEAQSFVDGTLRKILVPAGESVDVGTAIALVGAPDEPIEAGSPQATAPEAAPARSVAASPAGTNGVAPSAAVATAVATGNGASAPVGTDERVFVSPIARRIASENGLDVSRLTGTGPNGRIIRQDVEAALSQQMVAIPPVVSPTPSQPAPAEAATPTTPAPAAAVSVPIAEGDEVVQLSTMRRTIARRLQQSMQNAPHFYITMSVDTTRLAELRERINDYAKAQPGAAKVSYNDLIVKACAMALARMPQVNASFDGDRIVRHHHINIGVAVALDDGLIVPVITDADRRGVLDLAHESTRLVEAARTGKLTPADIQGGTFTVSNLGMFGVEEFTAVINPPESAILAVGVIEPTAVVEEGQVVVRDRMKLTLSVDHRALDGATGARFLAEVRGLIEQPMGLLV
ncbi:MAG TPA: dihydrolipoamide acetyltransferase family protein [Ktedonobacterales bacterium]